MRARREQGGRVVCVLERKEPGSRAKQLLRAWQPLKSCLAARWECAQRSRAAPERAKQLGPDAAGAPPSVADVHAVAAKVDTPLTLTDDEAMLISRAIERGIAIDTKKYGTLDTSSALTSVLAPRV